MPSPFVKRSATEVLNDMIEHFVSGIVTVHDELHRNDTTNPIYVTDNPPLEYDIQCGQPDINNGLLVSVERIYGVRGNSFYEFIIDTDFSFNSATRLLTFVNGKEPDLSIDFKVTYKYDQRYTSGITNVGAGSATEMIFAAVAQRMGELFNSLELAKFAGFIDLAQGEDLRQLVKILGIEAKTASKSRGFVTAFRSGNSGDVAITVGTEFSTYASDIQRAIVFEVITQGLFVDGFTYGRVEVRAKTGYEGKDSNVAPNTITRVLDPAGSGVSSVNNPSNYTDYEIFDGLVGKYIYQLNNIPERVISGGAVYPPALTDKGLYAICNWIDQSVKTSGDWTETDPSGELTITEDDPQIGETKFKVTGVTGNPYIEIVTISVPRQATDPNIQGYDQLFIYIRGADGNEQFTVTLIDANGTPVSNDVNMYKFGTAGQSTTPTCEKEYKLFHGPHGLAGVETDNIDKVQIKFLTGNTTATYYIDWIAIGTFLQEVPASALDAPDEIAISYTSGRLSVYDSTTTGDFFDPYDGDSSDGSVDQFLVYYQWKNNIAGGQEEETDDELRLRGKLTATSLGRGTKRAIRKALLDIVGVKQAEVVDYDDDPGIQPGDIDVSVLSEGFVVSQALQAEIISTIDEHRPAGIRANIFLPEVRYINFTLTYVYDDSDERYSGTAGESALTAIVKSAIDDYFADEVEVNVHVYYSNLIAYLIKTIDVIISGQITFNAGVEPTYVDDNFSGTYVYAQPPIYSTYISSDKTGTSIVIQRGETLTVVAVKASSQ